MTDLLETARVEIERLEEDVLYTEKGHFAASSTLQKVHLRLGVLATVTAAASVATIVADSTAWVPGILALVASISSAVLTFVKPDERATQHLQAGRALGSLRVRMRQFRTLGLPNGMTPEDVLESVTSLSREKAATDDASPVLSDRAFKRGKKAIEAGRFQHAVDA